MIIKKYYYCCLFLFFFNYLIKCEKITNNDVVIPVGKKKSFGYNENSYSTCEEINVPMCRNMPYNMTHMPNQFNHETQQDAALEVHQFWALVEINCSKDLRFFLCSMYTPICIENYGQAIRPCRSVCERARSGCEKYMKKFGFDWPESMNCDLLPEYGSVKEVCMDPNDAESDDSKELQVVTPLINEKEDIKQSFVDNTYNNNNNNNIIDATVDLNKMCLKPLIKITDYTDIRYNKISTGNVLNCVRPCYDNSFTNSEYKFSYYWILFWSILCLLSSSTTTFTFIIDKSRFKYPEKPIIYLSICYLFVSFGFILKYIFGHERIACELDGSIKNTIISSRNTTGTSTILCTVVFILIYYFSMASSLWWVIISLTWFLAAGLKWGIEAISKYSYYFHLAAWLIPGIKTIIILSIGYVDADSLSGICYVGNTNLKSLNIFIIIPIFIYLIIGITFLLLGFISLFRLRNIIKKQQGNATTTKLEKLMLRIGIFSILYTIPATCLISCYFYEKYYRIEWEQNYLCIRQLVNGGSISLECLNTRKPEFLIFMLKYFSILIIGVTSGFWIWTVKSFISWKNFLKKLFFCCFIKRNKILYKKGAQKDSVMYFHSSNDLENQNNENNNNNNNNSQINYQFQLNEGNTGRQQQQQQQQQKQQEIIEANYCNIGNDDSDIVFNDNANNCNFVTIKNSKLIKNSSLSSDSTISTSQTNSYSLMSTLLNHNNHHHNHHHHHHHHQQQQQQQYNHISNSNNNNRVIFQDNDHHQHYHNLQEQQQLHDIRFKVPITSLKYTVPSPNFNRK